MNNLKIGIKITGKGYVMKADKSPLEKLVENQENEAVVEQIVNEAVPAAEPVIEKHNIGEVVEEEKEASVQPVIVEESVQLELKQSKKKGFNPNSISNAVYSVDDDNDGGVIANKMAIPQDAEGSQFIPPGANTVENDTKDKFEVTGFSIQYQPKGSMGIASENVRDYYDTLIEAMDKFKEDTYLKPDGNLSRISAGAPVICYNERQVKEFINEEWRKS
jgi:hypothetical protein